MAAKEFWQLGQNVNGKLPDSSSPAHVVVRDSDDDVRRIGLGPGIRFNGTVIDTTPELTFPIDGDPIGWNDGVEHVALAWTVDSGTVGSTLTFTLAAELMSQSGTATYRLRLGGARRATDGTIVLTTTQAATGMGTFSQSKTSSTATSPGGVTRLKLTVQSSAASSLAQISDGYASIAGGAI